MIRILLVVMALALPAHADEQVITLPRTKAVLHVPASFTRADRPGLVAAFEDARGTLVAVTRMRLPNPDAWRKKTRAAYLEQIERGVLASIPGKKLADRSQLANGIPAVDVEVRRDDGAAILVRVLVYRTYALGLAVEVPKTVRTLDGARAIMKSFAPPKP